MIFSPHFCTVHSDIYTVHSPTNALLLNLNEFKIYIKIHINIASTCFGLRPSSVFHSARHTTYAPPKDIVFKLSPCCRYSILTSGYFPGVWILKADVSGKLCQFHLHRWLGVNDHHSHLTTCEVGADSVPKRRLLIFRRRGNTQKITNH
jgi:hypothetical protein